MGAGILPTGPEDAEVLVVGEMPLKAEEGFFAPFMGETGVEFTKMFQEAGFLRSEARLTYVSRTSVFKNDTENFFGAKKDLHTGKYVAYLDKHITLSLAQDIQLLKEEIEKVKPKLIILLGDLPLWALLGEWGIVSWRGSILEYQGIPVVCTYSPAKILKNWEWRYIAVHDFRRAQRVLAGEIQRPEYCFQVSPTLQSVLDTFVAISQLPAPIHLSVDIETMRGHIACIGIAWSGTEAICIPFIDSTRPDKNYWTEPEELAIRAGLHALLTADNIRLSGQNWAYDAQYIAKYHGFCVEPWRDTMTTHHVLFAGLPNSLAFQASFYLDYYRFWKEDGKEQGGGNQLNWWTYNCEDCCNTWSIAEAQSAVLEKLHFPRTDYGTPDEIQQSLHLPVLTAMLRGVRIDQKLKMQLIFQIEEQIIRREHWLADVLGKPINVRSPKQLQSLFYEEFQQKKVFNYKAKTKGPSTNAESLDKIGKREPLLLPLIETINEIRQLSNAKAFCAQPLDLDKRLRCSYNVSGTETYRFSSSKDAFGFGTNLQNVTSGYEGEHFSIPNLRTLFIPDIGYSLGDFDLSAADAQVVAADAGDIELLELFQSGADLHTGNAQRWSTTRPIAKGCLHAANYVATPRALSMNFGITLQHAEFIINDWYSQRPLIREWHEKILAQLMSRRYVENAFGFRRFYFGRIDTLLKEAVAWIPQSTVAIVTNLGIRNVYRNLPEVQLLLQVHDSAVFQWPDWLPDAKARIIEQMRVPVPYARPLTIPVGAKTSMTAWGLCK